MTMTMVDVLGYNYCTNKR